MRLVVALLTAVAAVLALFWVMQFLVLSGGGREVATPELRTVDFVRVERDEQTRTRRRSRPEPPDPPKTPPTPPQPQVRVQQAAPQPVQQLDIPQLSLAANISGGPFIGSFTPQSSGQGDSELVPLVRLTPRYPRNAARDGIEGKVRLEVTVRPDGTVKNARVLEADPRGYFEAAAVSAARRGRFRPRTVNGEPVESVGQYTMIFRLE